MDVLCMGEFIRESVGHMEIDVVSYQTVAFFDKPPQELYLISNWFPFQEKEFQINLPRESWKVNDFSLAVHGVMVFCSQRLTGKYSFKHCNVFIDLAVKLQRAIDTLNVIKVRQAIC